LFTCSTVNFGMVPNEPLKIRCPVATVPVPQTPCVLTQLSTNTGSVHAPLHSPQPVPHEGTQNVDVILTVTLQFVRAAPAAAAQPKANTLMSLMVMVSVEFGATMSRNPLAGVVKAVVNGVPIGGVTPVSNVRTVKNAAGHDPVLVI